jgi:hypothetical protein
MKNQSLKCSQIVRDIPLERYRLPEDGRKWKQAARHRSDVLFRLSSYANPDGTFMRNGVNYSPRFKKLEKHIASNSFFRITDALRATGLLSWTRDNHYDCRVYVIHLVETPTTFNSKQVSDSETTPTTFKPEQIPHSQKTHTTLDDNTQNHIPHSPNHIPHSQKTPTTIGYDPSSVPSFKKPREREPSTDQNQKSNPSPSLSPAAGFKTHVEKIVCRAKTLSKGRASFCKTAKQDLLVALQELNTWTPAEMDDAIEAKLTHCHTDDPTSYVIFGSSFAADLVATITAKRQRDARESAHATHEAEIRKFNDQVERWIPILDAAKNDLSFVADVATLAEADRAFEFINELYTKTDVPYLEHATNEEEERYNNYVTRLCDAAAEHYTKLVANADKVVLQSLPVKP